MSNAFLLLKSKKMLKKTNARLTKGQPGNMLNSVDHLELPVPGGRLRKLTLAATRSL